MTDGEPGHTYRVFIIQPDLHLGAVAELKYDPQATEPTEVRLQETASVRGTLTDKGAMPTPDTQVRVGENHTFDSYFGAYPSSMANHYNGEAIYWGNARLSGWRRAAYNLITRGQNNGRFFGHVKGHPSFWGDICRDRIEYCRNFVFSDLNTLGMCPYMPYQDPEKPFVRSWFSASEGSNAGSFLKTIGERYQDRLEEQGGASIMYTHFGHGFVRDGKLSTEFQRLMKRLAQKNGWFVPVTTLLNFLKERQGVTVLDPARTRSLETRWLWEKVFRGTS